MWSDEAREESIRVRRLKAMLRRWLKGYKAAKLAGRKPSPLVVDGKVVEVPGADDGDVKESVFIAQQLVATLESIMAGKGFGSLFKGGHMLPTVTAKPAKKKATAKAGAFKTMADAKRWAKRRGIRLDLPGVTNMAAVNEAAEAVDAVMERYPILARGTHDVETTDWDEYDKNPELYTDYDHPVPLPTRRARFKFQGLVSFESPLCHQRIRAHAGDAWAATEGTVKYQDGPTIFLNPEGINTGAGSPIYASMGMVRKEDAFVRGAITHELGHAFLALVPGGDDNRRLLVSRAAVAAGYLDTKTIAKDLQEYATDGPDEFFAEMFLVLNSPGGIDSLSQEGRARVKKFREKFNELLGQVMTARDQLGAVDLNLKEMRL